jgi:hypothetical protein
LDALQVLSRSQVTPELSRPCGYGRYVKSTYIHVLYFSGVLVTVNAEHVDVDLRGGHSAASLTRRVTPSRAPQCTPGCATAVAQRGLMTPRRIIAQHQADAVYVHRRGDSRRTGALCARRVDFQHTLRGNAERGVGASALHAPGRRALLPWATPLQLEQTALGRWTLQVRVGGYFVNFT